MLLEVGVQTRYVTGIEKFHATAKYGVFNPFVVRQIQLVGEGGLFNASLQSCPTRKSALARNGELRVTETKVGIEDFGIGCRGEAWMKFAEPLGRSSIARGMIP